MICLFMQYPYLEENRMIIYTGVNDLINENDDEKVAKDIIALAESIKTDEIQVFISGIINTADKKKSNRIDNINKIIKDTCMKRHSGCLITETSIPRNI